MKDMRMSGNRGPSERAPSDRERSNDAPLRLRELTDVAKAKAIATGLGHAVGQAFEAEVEAVRYGAMGRAQGFRDPAEIRVSLTASDSAAFARVQEVSDTDLEAAMARTLGEAAGEEYRVRLMDKTYGRLKARSEGIGLMLQVGRV